MYNVLTMLVLGVLLVGAGLAVGRLAGRQDNSDFQAPAYALVTGWALLCLAGIVCAAGGAPLSPPMIAVGLFGVAGYFIAWSAAAGLARLAFAWLLLVPLLMMAAVSPPTMSDEFSFWLPNAKGLLAADMFAYQASPNPWTSKPEYPPALALIGYVAARFGGIDIEYPAKIFTVMLAGAFALVLAEPIARRIGTLAAIAIGVALASVLNPFFDPRLALSAYADTPTGLVLALCVAASWRALNEEDPRWPLRAAAAAIVLVLLKETNLVLVAALAAGLLACRRARLAIAITLPAFVSFGLWRLYIVIAGWTPAMRPVPVSEWDWRQPFVMVRALFGDRLANNPVLGLTGTALVCMSAVLLVWLVRTGDKAMRGLLILTGAVGAAWIAFLAWAYTAVIAQEAEAANSAWRYLSQLGPLLIFTIVVTVAHALPAWAAITGRRTALAVGVAACLVPLLVPLGTSAHWRVDCRFPDVVVALRAADAIAKVPIGSAPLALVNASEPGWYAEALDYELGRPVRSTRWYRDQEQVPRQGYRLDLSRLDRSRLLNDGVVPRIELARWEGDGWKPVLILDAATTPQCGAGPFTAWKVEYRSE